MNHFNLYLILSMSKPTKLFILAPVRFIGITFTEFSFVSDRVVNLFDFIVRINTVIIFTMLFRT